MPNLDGQRKGEGKREFNVWYVRHARRGRHSAYQPALCCNLHANECDHHVHPSAVRSGYLAFIGCAGGFEAKFFCQMMDSAESGFCEVMQ